MTRWVVESPFCQDTDCPIFTLAAAGANELPPSIPVIVMITSPFESPGPAGGDVPPQPTMSPAPITISRNAPFCLDMLRPPLDGSDGNQSVIQAGILA